MFNFKIYIYNYDTKEYVDYTNYGVFPPKFADLLDEQLDEAEIQLRNVPVEVFQQQTPVRIIITEKAENPYNVAMRYELSGRSDRAHNVSYTLTDGVLTEEITLNMLVATDKSFNSPRGLKNADGKLTYTHTLYLIERTKLLERFIGEGLTFTNALGNQWTSAEHLVQFSIQETSDPAVLTYKNSHYYLSPWDYRTNIEIMRFDHFINNEIGVSYGAIFLSYIYSGAGVYITDENGNNVYKQYLVSNIDSAYGFDVYEQIGENSPVKLNNGAGLNTYNANNSWQSYSLSLNEGKLSFLYTTVDPSRIDSSPPANRYAARFDIYIVKDLYPLKKRTIKDVINRCFNLIEPIKTTQAPRFILDDAQAESLDNIIAPEYAMTRMNLREQLKLVGGTIHAEPRIIDQIQNANAKGGWQYVVGFDYFGQITESHLKDRYCVSDEAYADINDYATELDTSVENLVNQLDWAQGVVAEPFMGGDLTLRSESANVRLEDNENSFIPTTLPIYFPIGQGSLYYCGQGVLVNGDINWYDAKGTQNGTEKVDITAFLFEATDYANTLSPYEGVYPYARSYALYYTQGEKGIKGLFFKQPAAVAPAYKDYAIVNIVRAAGGTIREDNYPLLRFQVNYLPVAATRIKTHKSVVMKGAPSAIVYNQAANLVETKYYGEHLKGVIARMGNVEKTKTFLLGHLSDLPKIGLLYDDNYYISTVRWELRPTYIVCTVGLSKDFNRLSEYVGISSNKRMWEVSERQIQRRETVYNPKIVISEKQYVSDTLFTNPALWLFNRPPVGNIDIDLTARIKTYDGTDNLITEQSIIKPIISVPFGNSMIFTCQMEDNYSAGQKVKYNSSGNGDVQGWWSAYVQYNDYYGRFKKLDFSICRVTGSRGDYPVNLPSNGITNNQQNITVDTVISAENMLYDKDSREIPQLTMELSAMSDDARIIIGSALMGNCRLVNKNPSDYQVYFSLTKISPIQSRISTFSQGLHDLPDTNYVNFVSNYVEITVPSSITLPIIGTQSVKAWAIITKRTTEQITVEDESGQVTTQNISKGGEIVLAGNFAPESGNQTYRLYFNVINDIETLTEIN